MRLKSDSRFETQTYLCNAKEWSYLFLSGGQVVLRSDTGHTIQVDKSVFHKLFIPVVKSGLGSYLKKIMEERSLSQHDVAFKTGITQMTVSKILRGVTKSVNTSTVNKLVTGLGVSKDELLSVLTSQ